MKGLIVPRRSEPPAASTTSNRPTVGLRPGMGNLVVLMVKGVAFRVTHVENQMEN